MLSRGASRTCTWVSRLEPEPCFHIACLSVRCQPLHVRTATPASAVLRGGHGGSPSRVGAGALHWVSQVSGKETPWQSGGIGWAKRPSLPFCRRRRRQAPTGVTLPRRACRSPPGSSGSRRRLTVFFLGRHRGSRRPSHDKAAPEARGGHGLISNSVCLASVCVAQGLAAARRHHPLSAGLGMAAALGGPDGG